jgi:hypothetical protein
MSWTPRHSWYRNKLSYEFMFRRFAGSSVSMALAAVLKADFHDFIIFFVLSERTIVLLPLEIDRVITAVHLDHHQLRLHIGFGLLSNLFVLLRESLTCVTFTGVSLWSLSLMFYLLPMLLFQKRDKKPAISTKSKQALQAASSQDNEFRHIMSWTQVYVTGLPRSLHPSDDEASARRSSSATTTVGVGDSRSYRSTLAKRRVSRSNAFVVTAMAWVVSMTGRGDRNYERK